MVPILYIVAPDFPRQCSRRLMSVSVVIPCFNAARTLAETLASVAAQSRPAAEVLVVDDGSTDGSAELAREAGARVIATGGNQGPSAARNLGVQAAACDLVAFVDADDLWTGEHLEVVAGLLDRYPEAVLAFSRIEKFIDGGGPDGGHRTWWVSPPVGAEQPSDLMPTMLETNPVPQSTVVARRQALLEVGGYDESMRYSEDYDLWSRLSARDRFVPSHRITCRYRIHAAQATAAPAGATSLARASWQVRMSLLNLLGPADDARAAPSVRERLRRVYEAELRSAWRQGDVATFDALLSAHALAPDGDHTARRWRVGRLALPVWATMRSAARALR